jgi:hypothetical protein
VLEFDPSGIELPEAFTIECDLLNIEARTVTGAVLEVL